MFLCTSKFIGTIEPYVLPVVVGIVSLIVGAVLVVTAVRQIRQQVKLYNSITLVELKSNKFHYIVFFLIIAFFMFFLITQMIDPEAPEVALMAEAMNMRRVHTIVMLFSLLVLLLCVQFRLAVLIKSRSAVVDRGVYAGVRYLDWYHVHDYMIDEDRGLVILSSNRRTFATLSGTTPPLKAAKNDIPKLKFILNKNKNKFSRFSDDGFYAETPKESR